MAYTDELKDPRWLKRRNRILARDNNECQVCLSPHQLHVHHKRYLPNLKPWEYDDNYMITLCNVCHSLLHQKPVYLTEKPKDEMDAAWQRLAFSVLALKELDKKLAAKQATKLVGNG